MAKRLLRLCEPTSRNWRKIIMATDQVEKDPADLWVRRIEEAASAAKKSRGTPQPKQEQGSNPQEPSTEEDSQDD